MSKDDLYQDGMTERELAKIVLDYIYPDSKPSIPIDPFLILSKLGVVYQFMDFDKLEGIYIFPDDNYDIPLVGINYNRPIVRKRYSAAHELCHHLKDKFTTVDESYGYVKDPKEQFAENFAAELLMPYDLFNNSLEEYDDLLSLDDVLSLSIKYGVSFSSCTYRVAWTFQKLDGDTDSSSLKKRIRDFKPKKRAKELGLSYNDLELESQAFDSYEFYYIFEKDAFWIRFKNFITYNENRVEGLDISQAEVDEIFSRIRIKGFDIIDLNKLSRDIIEVLGHADMYNL